MSFKPIWLTTNSYWQTGHVLLFESISMAHEGHSLVFGCLSPIVILHFNGCLFINIPVFQKKTPDGVSAQNSAFLLIFNFPRVHLTCYFSNITH